MLNLVLTKIRLIAVATIYDATVAADMDTSVAFPITAITVTIIRDDTGSIRFTILYDEKSSSA